MERQQPWQKNDVNYIIENFKRKTKGSLLDLGCGDGLISCLLSESGHDVKAIDTEK